MKTKIIGIPGWILDGKYFGITLSYQNFISKFGFPWVLSPEMVNEKPELDLLILPGGADLNPSTYNTIPSYYTGNPNVMLEHFDKEILPYYIENGTPILGICRGAQRLWVNFGGDYVQHNPNHKQTSPGANEYFGHELHFTDEYKHFSDLVYRVTSRHHQTMSAKHNVPNELEVIAVSNEKDNKGNDNIDWSIVEIFKHKTKNIYGVQYHPEDNVGETLSETIIKGLLGDKNA